jgi:hypothetical protein
MSIELLTSLGVLVIAFLTLLIAKWLIGIRKTAREEEQQRIQRELQEVSDWRAQHNSLYRESNSLKENRSESSLKNPSESIRSQDSEESQEWLSKHNSLFREPTAREIELREAKRELARKEREAQRDQERRDEAARAEKVREAQLWRSMPKDEQISLWLGKRERPETQPFGISPRGAELLAARWLEFLGEEAVEVTQSTGDGGVDVLTKNFCCQVKNYTKTLVSSSEVRDLFGTATALGLKPLIFTSSTLSSDASKFCEQNSISAIRYDALNAELFALNAWGDELLSSGQYS